MPRGCLFLQDEEGKIARVAANDLAQRIGELQEAPRLIVMASCAKALAEKIAPRRMTALPPYQRWHHVWLMREFPPYWRCKARSPWRR